MSDAPNEQSRQQGSRAISLGIRKWVGGPQGIVFAALFLLVLTLVALRCALFSREMVLSGSGRDLALQFIHWRKFGFDELRAGRLALWNPHVFCGTPFLGGFQSALLYPPNWLYLALPLGVAINVGIALHVFLAGFGMCLWARQRGLHPSAAIFSGVLFMFSGTYFPHIYAGHLPNLCTMAWGPFIFLSIDSWLHRRTSGWLLLGAASFAMQILAGHPQYVFYTGVAAGMYCAIRLAAATRRLVAVTGLAIIVVAGVGLSAAQLFEGFHAAGESVRNHGTPIGFAAVFSFPPENLLTLLTPNFFGDLTSHDYWGRWYLWEMSAFFGVSGLVMMVYALVYAPRFQTWSLFAVAVILFILALGSYTPFFEGLYSYAPGFGRFRGWSKFTFPAVMLLVIVASTGFDVLLRRGVSGLRPAGVILTAGLTIGGVALWILGSTANASPVAPEPWKTWVHGLAATGHQYLSSDQVDDAVFIREAGRNASDQLLLTSGTLIVLAAIFFYARKYPRALVGILALAVCEMLVYADSTLDTFRLRNAFATPDARFLEAHAGSFRVADANNHNLAMSLGAYDLWGYDPGVLRRYAEWMAVAQGREPDEASEMMPFTRFPGVFASLLRCRYVLPLREPIPTDSTSNPPAVAKQFTNTPAAPRLMLVPRARIIADHDDELNAVFAEGFEPSQEVVLESPPTPAPVGTLPAGSVSLVGETTDTLTIHADLASPAILVVTDTYSDGWTAHSLLPGRKLPSGQTPYEVMPADYCLRAIPLAGGHHEILLEYRPTAFIAGKWVSLTSLAIFGTCLAGWCLHRTRRKTDTLPSD